MNGTILLKNGVLVTLEPLKLEKRDLLIEEGRVAARDRDIRPPADCEVIDCRGRYVFPGFVNAQSHLFLSQTLGLSLGESEDALGARRRLSAALGAETIVTAAFSGALDAVSLGTTTLIDSLSAPAQVSGALDLIRDTVLTVGLRLVSSYEIDAAGPASERDQALREARRFVAESRSDKTGGLFGLEDLVEADDAFLEAFAAEVKASGRGLQVRIDRDAAELARSRERHGASSVERLARFGLLGSRCILVHAGATPEDDLARAREAQAWLVHCPVADALAGRPTAAFESFGDFAALGTGGCRSNVFAEARAAFLQARARGARVGPVDVIRMIVGAQQLASDLLGIELGSTNRDAGADFVVMNYHPRTPLTPESLPEHLLFGMGPEHIEQVLVDGSVIYRSGSFPDVDTRRLAPLMRRGAEQLWSALAPEATTTEAPSH
ncbi:MAG: amidohydrolase family protein [Planctomycetes bacterium]|nr:amidohydrolase family protein [Planctomycetota bacterium]